MFFTKKRLYNNKAKVIVSIFEVTKRGMKHVCSFEILRKTILQLRFLAHLNLSLSCES